VKKKSANGPLVDFDDCILECLDAGSRTVCWLLHLRIVFECSLIDREEQPDGTSFSANSCELWSPRTSHPCPSLTILQPTVHCLLLDDLSILGAGVLLITPSGFGVDAKEVANILFPSSRHPQDVQAAQRPYPCT